MEEENYFVCAIVATHAVVRRKGVHNLKNSNGKAPLAKQRAAHIRSIIRMWAARVIVSKM